MNDEGVVRYQDLQLLVQMLQVARRRADLLREAEQLTFDLARMRSRCDPELREVLDRLTLIDEYHAHSSGSINPLTPDGISKN